MATTRVEFGGDSWADIKSEDDLTGEDEVIVRSAVKLKGPVTGEEERMTATAAGTVMMEFAMLARVITSWSLPQPINPISIQRLGRAQLKPLRAAIKPHMEALRDDPNDQSAGETGTAS